MNACICSRAQQTRDGESVGLIFHRGRALSEKDAIDLGLWPAVATAVKFLAIAVTGLSFLTINLSWCFGPG
jgi:hypothetical protein